MPRRRTSKGFTLLDLILLLVVLVLLIGLLIPALTRHRGVAYRMTCGTPPGFGSQPACRKDALLVNDPPAARR